MVRKSITALAIMAIAFTGLSCSGGGSAPASDNAPSLKLVWPEGVEYDQRTMRLDRPEASHFFAPEYVVGITLTVFGPEMPEPLFVDVPPDSLNVNVTVPMGELTFFVEVYTDMGVIFGGEATYFIGPGFAGPVVIALDVNGPPVIQDIFISNTNPAPGETVFVDAVVFDPDPGDFLTYEWRLNYDTGSDVIFTSEPFVSFPAPNTAGDVFFELYVEDGHGGFATATQVGSGGGGLFITHIDVDIPVPVVGDLVTVTAFLEDPTLTGVWYDWWIQPPAGTGYAEFGMDLSSIIIDIQEAGTYYVALNVTGPNGGTDGLDITIGGTCATLANPATALTNTQHPSTNGTLTFTWTAPAGEVPDGYKVDIYDDPGNTWIADAFPTGTAIDYTNVGLIGTDLKFKVTPYLNCGSFGPVSVFSAVNTTPGVEAPPGLTPSPGSPTTIDIVWTAPNSFPLGGATSYMVYYKQTSTAGVVSTTVFDGFLNPSVASATHTPCTANADYYYIVTGSDASYTSEPSVEAMATCPP